MYGTSTISRTHDGEVNSFTICGALDRYLSSSGMSGTVCITSVGLQKGGGINGKSKL